MFKTILKFICLYRTQVSLYIVGMYDMNVHNAAHHVCLYT